MSERRSDFDLLREFVRSGDQAAFSDVVGRHLDLVYATALRKVEDAGAAQEIAQNVFSALTRKAWRFAPDDSLPAWLYKTTLLEAKEWLRGELRRRRREQTAVELGTTMKTPDEQTAFRALLPLLDEALLSLREKDRTALLLRFYESQSLRDVGAALGVSEDTAQKRVAVALEKVSGFFQQRGFRTATMAVATAALQNTATAAPGFMVGSVTAAAVKTAPAVTGGLTVLLGRLLSLSKAQLLSISAVALLAPALWYWQFHRPAPASEPLPAQTADETLNFDQAVDLYAKLMNRSVLCYPGLHRIPISVTREAKDRDAVIAMLGAALEQQTQTATIMDGGKFAVLVPTNLVKSVSTALQEIPYPVPAGPKMPPGTINFVNVPTREVLRIYGEYTNRELPPANNISPRSTISFHNQTWLTRPEFIYALDVLLSWQGFKTSLIGQDRSNMNPI